MFHIQAQQKGTIGIKNDCMWYEPLTNSTADQEAAQRGLESSILDGKHIWFSLSFMYMYLVA